MWGRHRLRITGRRVREKTPGAIRDSRQTSLPCHDERWHGGENAAGYPPQSFRDRARSFNDRSVGDRDGSGKAQAGRGSERKGQHSSDVREMGYEEGLGKTRPQNLRTQREEKQKKNDKPHIRQLVGYGLRCGQDSLAFSNELFGGFLMHGEETGRITNHKVRDADVRNGDCFA